MEKEIPQLEKLDDFRWLVPKQGEMRVPGLIYANESMAEKIRSDRSPLQVANVACLPGVVNYSLAMPDIHWGYGAPIGGVAGIDAENGVIVPGIIGYDINCLAGDTKILTQYGYYLKIDNPERYFQFLRCFNLSVATPSSTEITRFIKIKPKNKVYRVTTVRGHRIVATEDHPFWTPAGMVLLKDLEVKDKVAIYPFEGVPYEETSNEIIVDEEDIKKFFLKLSRNPRGHGLQQILNQLKRRKLLPLRYNSLALPILLKLMGYIFGDGTLFFDRKKGKGQVNFYGEKEDLQEIEKDIEKLGFKSLLTERKREHKIKTAYSVYEFETVERCCHLGGTAIAILFAVFGVPCGNKAKQDYGLPSWIRKAPLWQKRLFLSTFFGAELSTPKFYSLRNYNAYCPILSMNKRKKYLESGRLFLEQISQLLEEFGVKTLKVSQRKEGANKDGNISYRLRLILSGRTKSLLNLYGKVGFEYNKKRSFSANLSLEFLKLKKVVISRRDRTSILARELHNNSGLGAKAIYKKLSNPWINSRFIERSIYERRKTKGLSQNNVNHLPEVILERDKEQRVLRSRATQTMSEAVAAQKHPGPWGSPIFKALRCYSSAMCHRHKAFVAPCTDFKSGTPNSQHYSETAPKARVAFSLPKFNAFVEEFAAGDSGMVWDEIADIKQVPFNNWVYDFSVLHQDHNFIANNFIVSNCGIRLLRTTLKKEDIKGKVQDLLNGLFYNIPSGVGSTGKLHLKREEVKKVLTLGAGWAVENGYGSQEDLKFTEEEGCYKLANPISLSSRAIERGQNQLGTLGAGNHFMEIQVVEIIYDENVARIFGLFPGQVMVMIHTGSRGLGYQVCDDYLKILGEATKKYGIKIPDRQLACAPTTSSEGQSYFSAMAAAANYAWANRHIIMHWARETFEKVLSISSEDLGMKLVYDVAHNIGKIEEHLIKGEKRKLYVHRKGATRAFAAGREEIPVPYRDVGQPVLIPGTMGTASYVLVGTEKAMEETWGSTCHGAGREMSRHQAVREAKGRMIDKELKEKGILSRTKNKKALAEEAPFAYKDVDIVVDVVDKAGLSKKVARMKPLGVIKG